MIVDTSAFLAIAFDEPEARSFIAAILSADSAGLPSVAYVEANLKRLAGGAPVSRGLLDDTAAKLLLTPIAFGADHALIAADAIRRFGKGRHPAGLNYADCMVYAVAKLANAPLLYKGRDFARTDLVAALPATA